MPSLRNVILVDNSEGRVGIEGMKSTVEFGELLDGMSGMRGKEVVPDEPLMTDDIINSELSPPPPPPKHFYVHLRIEFGDPDQFLFGKAICVYKKYLKVVY